MSKVERGGRGKLAPDWSFDIAAFYNRYRNLATNNVVEAGPLYSSNAVQPIGLRIAVEIGNAAQAERKGVELLVRGSPAPWWQLEASYSFLDLDQTLTIPPALATPLIDAGLSARHQVRLRNTFEVTPDLQLSSFAHHVSAAPAGGREAYTKLDMRLTWSPMPNLEIAAVGADLLKRRQIEFRQNIYAPVAQLAVPRRGYVEARVRF
ncbi:TonB-dependent receptor domain-containing protein [Novosphingobium sp. M1R2S20]|uniref:TonB-dependent receptor n=1 Tax=Novosphingobium rhizovicinum TaxID=3228928 RepID=A0ABV3R7C4_9SPHN